MISCKIYFNLAKTVVLGLFKNDDNSESLRLEQRFVIKFLMAEKDKPCEIYKRMCDVNGEACFNKKMFTNDLNMGSSLWVWVKNAVYGVETYWLSGQKNVPVTVVNKSSSGT